MGYRWYERDVDAVVAGLRHGYTIGVSVMGPRSRGTVRSA